MEHIVRFNKLAGVFEANDVQTVASANLMNERSSIYDTLAIKFAPVKTLCVTIVCMRALKQRWELWVGHDLIQHFVTHGMPGPGPSTRHAML